MTVALEGDTIRLSGPCGVEDAETLLALLSPVHGRCVDLAAAGPIHTAVFQVLLVARPPLAATPPDPFFASWLLPRLQQPG